MSSGNSLNHYKGRKVRINFWIIILMVLFVYIVFSVFTGFKKNKVNFYEVTEGSMTKNTEHKGIIIRKETVMNTQKAGYINYFVSGGKRVSVGTEMYSIDETGAMNNFLSSGSAYDFSFSPENMKRMQKDIRTFSAEFDDNNFNSVYNYKSSLNNSLLEYVNVSGSDSLQAAMEQSGIGFTKEYAPVSGVVSLSIDGFENRDIQSINDDDFNMLNYHVDHMNSGQMVELSAPVCRIVTDEDWQIVFRLSDEDKETFSNINNLRIRFKGSPLVADCQFQEVNSVDGNTYGRLYLDRYMVDFINERFVSFNIDTGSNTGLKIPKSAVVNKTFLLIPDGYLARGGDDTSEGFYKEVYTENGTGIQYIPTEIYYSDGEKYYINFSSDSEFQPGDYVVKPGNNERFKLGETASLEGVYNINKGYAVFKQIDIIDSNDEYYTVRKNQKYGLNVYDHILFDPEGINEGDFIYQ